MKCIKGPANLSTKFHRMIACFDLDTKVYSNVVTFKNAFKLSHFKHHTIVLKDTYNDVFIGILYLIVLSFRFKSTVKPSDQIN